MEVTQINYDVMMNYSTMLKNSANEIDGVESNKIQGSLKRSIKYDNDLLEKNVNSKVFSEFMEQLVSLSDNMIRFKNLVEKDAEDLKKLTEKFIAVDTNISYSSLK
ncbi:MAG: hypothetical protein E7488_08115 [Ruminococcaceae bacterium]|nr:hypothetical protein [Oscillospiraceae bacterium]